MTSQTLGEVLRYWRKERQISVSHLATLAQVHRSTLSRWESDAVLPRAVELDAVLTILDIPPPVRTRCWQMVSAPRTIQWLRQAEGEIPLGLGDLLRALRLRANRTQGEVARAVGVRQGLLSRWESGMNRPDDASLHALCFALGASAEETVYLTARKFTAEPIPETRDSGYEALIQLDKSDYSSHRDIAYLALSAHFARLERSGKAERHDIASVWARQANYQVGILMRLEAGATLARYALKIGTQNNAPVNVHLAHALTALAMVAYLQKTPQEAQRYIPELKDWGNVLRDVRLRAWFSSNLGCIYAMAGHVEEAVTLGECGVKMVDNDPDECPYRVQDLIALLGRVNRPEAALSHLGTLPPAVSHAECIDRDFIRLLALIQMRQKSSATTLYNSLSERLVASPLPINQKRLSSYGERLEALK